MIRPKRSTLTSRFDVDLERTYTFYHSGKEWTGVPIMASNMDNTGTFEMHKALSQFGMMTCIARHYNKDGIKWNEAFNKNKLCVMSGISNTEVLEIVGVANTFSDVALILFEIIYSEPRPSCICRRCTRLCGLLRSSKEDKSSSGGIHNNSNYFQYYDKLSAYRNILF